MKIHKRISASCNYRQAPEDRAVDFIVIHFTANDGDSAEGNCNYFQNNNVGASAHYFVDESEIWQSVDDNDRAWHCGDTVYKHPECRNWNSIGIELCSRRDATGDFYFLENTVKNAAELTRAKMAEYNIPPENVIRHYDVTGKICPAPFVAAGYNDNTGGFYEIGWEANAWAAFKAAISGNNNEQNQEDEEMRYNTINEVPAWAQGTIKKCIDLGLLTGTGEGLDLSADMIRILVILDRAGKL